MAHRGKFNFPEAVLKSSNLNYKLILAQNSASGKFCRVTKSVFASAVIKAIIPFMTTFEVELKARLANPTAIEAQAAQLGLFTKETFKEDIYFRRRGDIGLVPKERYRLRREAGRAIVTFKNKARPDNGGEVNEEVEFEVDNAHAFFQFAHQFGFEPFVVKRKKSRVYRIGRANVEFNEVENLGHFIEIEILCDHEAQIMIARTEIARLLNELGLGVEELEPRYYIELIQEAHPVRYRFINDTSLDWPFEEVR
jgi:predicted adenylyl cyclase CyaB